MGSIDVELDLPGPAARHAFATTPSQLEMWQTAVIRLAGLGDDEEVPIGDPPDDDEGDWEDDDDDDDDDEEPLQAERVLQCSIAFARVSRHNDARRWNEACQFWTARKSFRP